jgi:hypothetical protein
MSASLCSNLLLLNYLITDENRNSADFMDGIKAAPKHAELYDHIQLFSESIGLGGNERRYMKRQKSYCFVGRIFHYLFYR